MVRKIIEIKHHLSSGCCMCSRLEDFYATRTNQSVPEGFLLAMIELAVSDLELAWNIEKNGVGDKNGFIKIRLGKNLPDKYTLSCNCLLKKAERQLREKSCILGISA